MSGSANIDWGGEKKVNLALQGGGSHGAFTWGVLDRILEDGRLDIEAITGASAGAMNAVALTQGYMEGGREGARRTLETFWRSMCEDNPWTSQHRDIFDRFFGSLHFGETPFGAWMRFFSSFASPYDFNPLNINPLRDHLARIVDFQKVRACEHIQLFVSATNVHTGRIAVFERERLTVDHVMASACLPTLFQAVEIDGVPYWDGGYMGNPALFPLFYKSRSPDILIVQVNPIERAATPRTAGDIQNRLNEITFNASLLGELRAIDFVNRLIDQGALHDRRYGKHYVHRIDGADDILHFTAASKLDRSWALLTKLRDIGRDACAKWLSENYESIGKKGTLNLRMAFN